MQPPWAQTSTHGFMNRLGEPFSVSLGIGVIDSHGVLRYLGFHTFSSFWTWLGALSSPPEGQRVCHLPPELECDVGPVYLLYHLSWWLVHILSWWILGQVVPEGEFGGSSCLRWEQWSGGQRLHHLLSSPPCISAHLALGEVQGEAVGGITLNWKDSRNFHFILSLLYFYLLAYLGLKIFVFFLFVAHIFRCGVVGPRGLAHSLIFLLKPEVSTAQITSNDS